MPIFALFMLVLYIISLVGWVSNVIWTFHATTVMDIVLGVVGIIVPFIGLFHGLWVLF